MNVYFRKALFYLDNGDFSKGEMNLKNAIDSCRETNNKMELIEISSCYAEVLYQMGRFEDAEQYIDYVIKNTELGNNQFERKTVMGLKNKIEREK